MDNKLYVGNIPYDFRDQDLEQAFSAFGHVESARVMMERHNNRRSKGFGFVEMGDAEQAQAAIEGLNGKDCGGRDLIVNVARPPEQREQRPRRDFGNRDNRGGYGDRGDRGYNNSRRSY